MPRWRLSLPRPANLRGLRAWTHDLLAHGTPREIISFHLLSFRPPDLSLEELEATSTIEREVAAIMVERNLLGIELEKAGRIDEAVALYESNLADWFGGNHPYDRPRVIYSRTGRYRDAIRVCEAFVSMADELIALGSPRVDLLPKRETFAAWVSKLRPKAI